MASFRPLAPVVVAIAASSAAAPSARAEREAAPRPPLRAEVAFEPGGATLSAEAAQVLDDLATALRGLEGDWVVVIAPSALIAEEGERDDPEVVTGAAQRELEGQRRARVEAFLASLGVPRAKVVSVDEAADLDPEIERVMVYLDDATVDTESEIEVESDGEAGEGEGMSFSPVLPGERREIPAPDEAESSAWTQPYYGAAEYVNLPRVSQHPPAGASFFTRVGLGVSVGAGVAGFVDGDTRAFAGAGGTWDARLTLGTRMPVAVEASYFGSANQIEALGLDDGALLLANGFESDIRVELLPSLPVRPYVVGGFGWTYFQLANAGTNTSNVRDSDGVLHAPIGAGVTVQRGRVLFDLRGQVRAAFDDTMLSRASDDSARLSTWGVVAKVGWEL